MTIHEGDNVMLANGTVGVVVTKRFEMEYRSPNVTPIEIYGVAGSFGPEEFTQKDVLEIW
jgi:hypothetical protein